MAFLGGLRAGRVARTLGSAAPGPGVRRLNPSLRWLLYAASTLVFLAGVQLTVFTEQTATFFAWTVAPPLTAAFLGAAYWAAVPVELIAAREATWARARVALPGIWLFTTLTLVVTLVHFDRFHFSSPVLSAQAAAWFWLAIYAGVPVAMLLVLVLQVRGPGSDPGREKPFPWWLRVWLGAEGAGMLAVGLILLVAPSAVFGAWPWTLTALTGRAIGAWFIGIGFAAVQALREDDVARVRPIGGGYTCMTVLQLIAVARYPGDLSWGASGWIYVAFLLSLFPIGAYLWLWPVVSKIRRRVRGGKALPRL